MGLWYSTVIDVGKLGPAHQGRRFCRGQRVGWALAFASPMSSTSLAVGITHRYSVDLHQYETRDSLSLRVWRRDTIDPDSAGSILPAAVVSTHTDSWCQNP